MLAFLSSISGKTESLGWPHRCNFHPFLVAVFTVHTKNNENKYLLCQLQRKSFDFDTSTFRKFQSKNKHEISNREHLGLSYCSNKYLKAEIIEF